MENAVLKGGIEQEKKGLTLVNMTIDTSRSLRLMAIALQKKMLLFLRSGVIEISYC